jgi:hypothetical protein
MTHHLSEPPNLPKLMPQIVMVFHSMQLCPANHISGIDWNAYAGFVTRPAICLERLTVRADGQIQYELKNLFRGGRRGISLTQT